MRLHYLQHVPFEGLGSIESWAIRRDHEITRTRLFAGDPFPGLDRFDLLVIMGGPMSVHDEGQHVWLKGEKWFIREVLATGKPILGICLGAQFLADALGAAVSPGPVKEIGWFPLRRDPAFAATALGAGWPMEAEVFQWHGETFELPPAATRIASSEHFANQGFIYRDNVVALQFHPEMTVGGAEELIACGSNELVDSPTIQSAEVMLAEPARFAAGNLLMDSIMDHLVASIGG